MERRRFYLFKVGIVALFFGLLMAQAVFASTVLECDVETPSEGCVFVGVKGSYIAQQQAGLDRLNAIRYEACKEGVPGPGYGHRPLTLDDYVPLKWSSLLEKHARLRAAEAITAPSYAHTRPNGRAGYAIYGNTQWIDEDISWRGQGPTYYYASPDTFLDITRLIDLWYGEKTSWINDPSKYNHYSSIINPAARYVGLGYFYSQENSYGECVVAQLGGEKPNVEVPENVTTISLGVLDDYGDESFMPAMNDIVQKIEIKSSDLQEWDILGAEPHIVGSIPFRTTTELSTSVIAIGDVYNLYLGRFALTTSLMFDRHYVVPLSTVSWSSSNPSVVKVEADGTMRALSEGVTNITASCLEGGTTVQVNVTDPTAIKTVPKLKKLKLQNRKVRVRLSRFSKKTAKKIHAKGYEIQVAMDSDFTKIVKQAKVTRKKKYWYFKGKKKKTYYVRIRYYNDKTHSGWSNVRKIKIKK